MMKTVIFGGTFDPPHIGHKNLLTSVMAKGYDRAIVIPAGNPPHKKRDKDARSFSERLRLTTEMFRDLPSVTVSDIEGTFPGKSYTVNTLEALKEKYPSDKLYLLMGSDMLFYIEKWYRFEDILRYVTIISAARSKEDAEKTANFKKYLESRYECDIIIYNVDIVEISSTFLRSELVSRIELHNKTHLSEKRLRHVRSVADYAVMLAGFHNIDPQKAYIASLAHDCTKYLGDKDQLDYFEKHGIKLTDDERACPKIYHQISGAHFAKTVLGIDDEDILDAIRYHTTGREDMSKLEMLVCLADSIEPTRDYEGVEKMREVAKQSLEKSLILCFDRLIEYIKQRGLYMHPQTLSAQRWLKGNING